MKNLIYGVIATVLFIFTGNAQEKVTTQGKERIESAFLIVKSADGVVKYKYNSVKDFEQNTDTILDEISSRTDANFGDECNVTIEVSVTVSVGLVSTTVSASITTSCADAGAAVKRLRAMLLASLN